MTLAVAAALAYPNLGFFHVHYKSPIHWHETFHYFMGAKYLPELGYTRIYEATWVAGRELGAFAPIRRVRDLATYALRDVASIDAAAVRARFAPARWQAFKRDLLVFGPHIEDWERVFFDHGYNDPPPRALALHLLVRWLPATPLTLTLLTSLDYAIVLAAFWAVWRAFKWMQARLTGARDPALARCLVAAAALGLTVSLTLVAVPRTRELTGEFTAKIRLHNQGTYTNHVGLGSLIAFHTAPWVERPDGSVFVPHEAALAARPAPWVLPTVSVLYLLVALPLILKARPLESVMYAVPLVFCALSPAGYYYSFLVLLVLLPWRDGAADPVRLVAMGFLAFVGAAGYAFELTSSELLPLFYEASIQLGVFLLLWLVFEYIRLAASVGRSPSVSTTPASTTRGG